MTKRSIVCSSRFSMTDWFWRIVHVLNRQVEVSLWWYVLTILIILGNFLGDLGGALSSGDTPRAVSMIALLIAFVLLSSLIDRHDPDKQ